MRGSVLSSAMRVADGEGEGRVELTCVFCVLLFWGSRKHRRMDADKVLFVPCFLSILFLFDRSSQPLASHHDG